MTLIPVTRIAASVDWSTKGGASAWIGADMSLPIGPCSSIGSPMTFMIRPSVLGPTGTRICEPVERDRLAAGEAVGRIHGDGANDILAEVLGDFEHQAVAVIVGLERGQDRRQSPSKATSTTAPMTWLTRPVRLLVCAVALGVAGAAAFGAAFLRGLVSAAVAIVLLFLRPRRRPVVQSDQKGGSRLAGFDGNG